MRVLLISDAVFAAREAAMLGRLEIGLADEGIRLIIAVPAGATVPDALGRTAEVIAYERSPLPLGWRFAVRPFLREIRDRVGAAEPTFDVVHAFGGAAWRFGLEIARQTNAGLALEVWRAGLVDRLAAIRRTAASADRRAHRSNAQHPAAPEDAVRSTNPDAAVPIVVTAPDRATERAVSDAIDLPVVLAPWGVHAAAEPRKVFRGPTAGVVMAGGGRDVRTVRAAFDGWVGALENAPSMMLFVDSDIAERARLWERAGELGVRDRVSLVADLELRRELALRADLLLHPETRGERRTLLLDAMAVGMPIVAADDPHADELIEGTTAAVVRTTDAEAWTAAITRLASDHHAARALGAAALGYVRANHRASAHLAATIGAYERLTVADAAPIAWSS